MCFSKTFTGIGRNDSQFKRVSRYSISDTPEIEY